MADAAINGIEGLALIEHIVAATGLPMESTRNELLSIANRSNMDLNTLTLDDVRDLLAEYMQDVLLQALREYS